jgi:hypothetical protein
MTDFQYYMLEIPIYFMLGILISMKREKTK